LLDFVNYLLLLNKKIKMLQGVRVVDQVLSLTSGRALQDEETFHDLLLANPSLETDGLKLEVIENPQFKRKCSPPRKSVVIPNTEEAKIPETKSQPQPELLYRESPSTVIVKLSFREHHRRIPFNSETVTYARLTELCTQFFGVKNVHRMQFSYVDDEGDKTQLSTDAELKYALEHFAKRSPKTDDAPVLKLVFTVKPVAAKPEEKSIGVNPPDATPCEEPKAELSAPVLLLQGREVKDGDIVMLQAERDGQLLNLAYSMKENKVVAARQPPTLPPGVVRKNTQWIVEKVPSKQEKEATDSDAGKEVFFLSCRCLSNKGQEPKEKKNLRVLPNGQVNHKGGRGLWARFEILTSPEGKVSLRSVGRSVRHFENNFLGIVKNNNKEFLVSANLDENSDDAKFTLQFV